jgi:hypothetical protein
LWLAELHADITKTPWWTLTAENVLGLDLNLSLLGRTLARYHRTLSDITIALASASVPYQGITITPDPASVPPGGQLKLTAHVAGAAAQHVTWHTAYGNGTITTGGLYTAPTAPGSYQVTAAQPPDGLDPGAAGLLSIQVIAKATWTATTVGLPAGLGGCSGIGLGSCSPAVACASETACAGSVSYVGPGGISHGLLLWGSGSTWAEHSVPLPADGDESQPAMLRQVSCTSATSCVATGSYTTTSSFGASMLVSGHGSTWKAGSPPMPAGGGPTYTPEVTATACGSAGSCMAIGGYNGSLAMLEWFDGSSWTPAQAPVPAGNPPSTEEVLYSAACAGTATCVSSGLYGPNTGQEVLVSGHGAAWTAEQITLPPGAEASSPQQPNGVACEPSGHCVAVLPYANALGQSRSLVVSGYGTSWTAMAAPPVPADGIAGSAVLFTAACAATDCLLAGEYTQASGAVAGLLLWGYGSKWTPTQEPLPPGATRPIGPSDFSCSSATLCVAAGNYADSSGNPQGMLVWGSGSSWNVTAAPPGIVMYDAGCAPNGECAAIGSDTGPDIKIFWGPA